MTRLDRESALLGRLRRALRALNRQRLSGDAFDSILGRVRARLDALQG